MTFKDPAVTSFLKLHYVFQHLQHFLDFWQRCHLFYVWTYIYSRLKWEVLIVESVCISTSAV